MMRAWTTWATLALLLLAGGGASAQPRGPFLEREPDTPEAIEARRLQLQIDLLTFLPRLVGRFRIEGTAYPLRGPRAYIPIPLTGMQDCIAIGAGVQCVSNLTGPGVRDADRVATVTLRGVDLNAMKIRFLEVNNRGFGSAIAGTLRDDTLTTRTRVPNTPASAGLDTVTRIHASRDGSIRIRIDTEVKYEPMYRIELQLRRVPQVPAGRSGAPRPP